MIIVYNKQTKNISKIIKGFFYQPTDHEEIEEYSGDIPGKIGDYKYINGMFVEKSEYQDTIEDLFIETNQEVSYTMLPENTLVKITNHDTYDIVDGEFIFSSEQSGDYIVGFFNPDYKDKIIRITVL